MLNIWFSDEFYEDVDSVNIDESMVTIDVDDRNTEIKIVDNADVLIVEKENDDVFSNIDAMIEDLKRVCNMYGHQIDKCLAGLDEGQLKIEIAINAFEI